MTYWHDSDSELDSVQPASHGGLGAGGPRADGGAGVKAKSKPHNFPAQLACNPGVNFPNPKC